MSKDVNLEFTTIVGKGSLYQAKGTDKMKYAFYYEVGENACHEKS